MNISKNVKLVVLTAGVLHDHLVRRGDFVAIPWSLFHLLIMDGCHHTRDKHVYNKIMMDYMAAKTKGHHVPLVFGLTSFIPTKAKGDLKKAVKHIAQLCANLHTNTIVRVTKNVIELMAFTKAPDEAIYNISSVSADPFHVKISRIIESSEREVLKESPPSGTVDYGTLEYQKWLNKRRLGNDLCIRCLVQLNRALIINKDVTICEAARFLQAYLAGTNRSELHSSQRNLLDSIQQEVESVEESCRSPRLERLREVLVQIYRDTPNVRTVLFTKTAFSKLTLVDWISFDADLQFLKPVSLNGSETSEEKELIVKKLRTESKVVVCSTTSVQGLSLTECHVAVRYGVIEDEISVAYQGQDDIEQHCSVRVLEAGTVYPDVSEEALARFCSLSLVQRRRKIQAVNRLELEKQKKIEKPSVPINNTSLCLYCKSCGQYLCRGDSVRKLKGMHKVAIGRELKEHAIWPKVTPDKRKSESRETYAVDDVFFAGKVSCRSCISQLGSVMLTDGDRFPGIKSDSLLYSYGECEALSDDVKKISFSKAMKTSFTETIIDLSS